MMMYELHVPLVMMANKAIERGPGSGVTKNEIKNDLKVSNETMKFKKSFKQAIEKVLYLLYTLKRFIHLHFLF